MKKKKAPFIWVPVLVVFGGALIVVNASSHQDPKDAQQQQQQQQGPDPKDAPSANTLQQTVASQMKTPAGPQRGPGGPGGPGGMMSRPMLQKPGAGGGPMAHKNNSAKQKPEISSQTLGQWYHSDSVKSAN